MKLACSKTHRKRNSDQDPKGTLPSTTLFPVWPVQTQSPNNLNPKSSIKSMVGCAIEDYLTSKGPPHVTGNLSLTGRGHQSRDLWGRRQRKHGGSTWNGWDGGRHRHSCHVTVIMEPGCRSFMEKWCSIFSPHKKGFDSWGTSYLDIFGHSCSTSVEPMSPWCLRMFDGFQLLRIALTERPTAGKHVESLRDFTCYKFLQSQLFDLVQENKISIELPYTLNHLTQTQP